MIDAKFDKHIKNIANMQPNGFQMLTLVHKKMMHFKDILGLLAQQLSKG